MIIFTLNIVKYLSSDVNKPLVIPIESIHTMRKQKAHYQQIDTQQIQWILLKLSHARKVLKLLRNTSPTNTLLMIHYIMIRFF